MVRVMVMLRLALGLGGGLVYFCTFEFYTFHRNCIQCWTLVRCGCADADVKCVIYGQILRSVSVHVMDTVKVKIWDSARLSVSVSVNARILHVLSASAHPH